MIIDFEEGQQMICSNWCLNYTDFLMHRQWDLNLKHHVAEMTVESVALLKTPRTVLVKRICCLLHFWSFHLHEFSIHIIISTVSHSFQVFYVLIVLSGPRIYYARVVNRSGRSKSSDDSRSSKSFTTWLLCTDISLLSFSHLPCLSFAK